MTFENLERAVLLADAPLDPGRLLAPRADVADHEHDIGAVEGGAAHGKHVAESLHAGEIIADHVVLEDQEICVPLRVRRPAGVIAKGKESHRAHIEIGEKPLGEARLALVIADRFILENGERLAGEPVDESGGLGGEVRRPRRSREQECAQCGACHNSHGHIAAESRKGV